MQPASPSAEASSAASGAELGGAPGTEQDWSNESSVRGMVPVELAGVAGKNGALHHSCTTQCPS